MTQEEKQILLLDLCARLPYGVKLHIPSFSDTPQLLQQISDYETVEINDYTSPVGVGEVKPYLRPMSSMTEKEKGEFAKFACVNLCPMMLTDMLTLANESKMFDWLNAHHFEYRGLIEKGLALPAPEGMY